jgi:hypothetical protein
MVAPRNPRVDEIDGAVSGATDFLPYPKLQLPQELQFLQIFRNRNTFGIKRRF